MKRILLALSLLLISLGAGLPAIAEEAASESVTPVDDGSKTDVKSEADCPSADGKCFSSMNSEPLTRGSREERVKKVEKLTGTNLAPATPSGNSKDAK